MKFRSLLLTLCFLVGISSALAQQPPPNDPIGEQLFPPELLMQHQKEIGLTDDQKNFVKSEMVKAQGRFTDLQWELQTEVETMASLLKKDKADEQQILSQLEKVLNLERDIKKTQITLIVRIKNKLTPEQQAQLTEIKKSLQQIEAMKRGTMK